MLNVPPEMLAGARPLDDEARRLIEAHCRVGAGLAARLLPNGSWLAEAVAAHHERLDGTGYPDGLRELQLSSLVRLLAVCDVYTALCSPRPHRPARETRTALTDTLLLAEQGKLDRVQAEHLLQLSFYPAGTVVELAEGNVAVVLATHGTYRDLNAPSRPVLAVLTDRQGRPLALPRYVDLGQCEGHSIVRTLAPEERRRVLGKRYPEFV
jgi:HD-GYP domain-containing protein (c-di-GMP phosphodiesterase class II)